MKKIFQIAICIFSITTSAFILNANINESIKLTDVVLYKNGLGFFQKSGNVTDNESFQITTKDSQINDILSSLYVIDLNKGKISSINYDINKNRIEDILIKLPKNNSLSEILKELQGAEVNIVSTEGDCAGIIIGLEPVNETFNNSTIMKDHKLIIIDKTDTIIPVLISSISSYKIMNKNLREDISKLLKYNLDSKYKHRKNINIATEGEGNRKIMLGYLLNVPVWKTTYRIILNNKSSKDNFIQGYAIAENTTEEDWTDVNISFVAGNPLSFIIDLAKPVYITRPSVPIPGLNFLNADWSKTLSTEVLTKSVRNTRNYARKASPQMMDMAFEAGAPPSFKNEFDNINSYISSSSGAETEKEKIGEMFAYAVKSPTSINSGESALIPIITEKINGNQIFYYDKSFSKNVTKAFVFNNDSKITFDAGPITFYQNNQCLGESMLNHVLLPNNMEILPYSIAESITIHPVVSSKRSDYIKGKIVNGLLTLTYTQFINTKWSITNKTNKESVLWLVQPSTHSFKLTKPVKLNAKIKDKYRFEIDLKPSQQTEFNVEEQRISFEKVSLINSSTTSLLTYSNRSFISEKDRKFLKELSTILKDKSVQQRIITDCSKQITVKSNEENRLRKNIKMLNNRGTAKEQRLRSKWIDRVADIEEEIMNVNNKIQEARNKVDLLEKEVSDKIYKY